MSSEGAAEGMTSAGGQSGTPSSLSHLAWNMIPVFRPGETDVNEYSNKNVIPGRALSPRTSSSARTKSCHALRR